MQPGQNNTSSSSAIWTAAMSSLTNKPKAKVKKSEMVYHVEFVNPIQLIYDPFWKEIFMNCARNKFPRGFVYNNRILRYRTNGNSIELPDNPEEFAQTAIYFFQENGKIHSKMDQEYIKRKYENDIIAKVAQDSGDWSKVARSKNRRSVHIRDYVDQIYSHLHKSIRDELFTQINIGFGNKLLTKNDVTYINGSILKIDGIHADENGVHILRNIPVQKSKSTKKDKSDDPLETYHKDWCKFLDEFKKYTRDPVKTSSGRSSVYINTPD